MTVNSPQNRTQNIRTWLPILAWVFSASMVAVLGYVVLTLDNLNVPQTNSLIVDFGEPQSASLPQYEDFINSRYLSRIANIDTVVPRRTRVEIEQYTVEFGDSIFGIASEFNITPETVLWANNDILNDNPDFLEPGMELSIPPIDGVYYLWKTDDTLEKISKEFNALAQDIVDWVGNRLDLLTPVIDPGVWVMIPDGEREFQPWIVPAIARGSAGVSKSVYGPGACDGGYSGGLNGSGAFIWPSPIHDIVGNDYWSGHLGLDIASDSSTPVYASDSGVVVFSGWATGGYGYMVMVDHGNGYLTVYAHLSQITAFCGQSVSVGQTIAYGGSSGNSTGPHLHFEVRLGGGYVNPWFVLPAP
ncbi:MAG: LysM peptidoglycan-binding domain-containing M23 family metallopeptidase [Chloroflexota bacterium]